MGFPLRRGIFRLRRWIIQGRGAEEYAREAARGALLKGNLKPAALV